MVHKNKKEGEEEDWEVQENSIPEKASLFITCFPEIHCRTMKVKGSFQGKPVIILIGCGAIHKFISKVEVEECQIPFDNSIQVNCSLLGQSTNGDREVHVCAYQVKYTWDGNYERFSASRIGKRRGNSGDAGG